jgi:M6 family metalloprotease-like protein
VSIKSTIILVVLQVALAADVWAAPAAPMTLELQQPDGYTFAAIPRGDEFAHWMETEDGHSIIRSKGTWYYAIRDGKGGLMASDLEVGSLLPEELRMLPLHLAPTTDPDVRFRGPIRKIRRAPDDLTGKTPQLLAVPAIQNVLFILVDYSDQVFTYPDSSFESLAFAATDSVKEYFLENSYGQMTVSPAAETYGVANDGIVHVTRGITHPNLGQSNWASEAREIVNLADSFVQFNSFDTNVDSTISPDELSIVIILAGYETSYGGQANALQPNVWGHAAGFTTLTLDGVNLSPYTMFGEAHAVSEETKHIATIGIMCHELGHLMFALPDLYDTDQSSAGIGVWGLMGAGSWNSTGSYSGETPAHLSAWSKIATEMTSPSDMLTDQSAVGFADVETNESIVRIWIDKYKVATNEYFLLENRQISGFDAGLPGAGLLIWHIDNGRTGNADESHKRVDVEEADGLGELDSDTNGGNAGDPFPGSTNNMLFDDGSTPNTRDYTGASTQIAVSNISPSSSNMSADIQVRAGGYTGHIRYDENGFETAWGLGQTLWLGLNMLNDTTYTQLEGVEVFILDNAGATVDISFYESMAGGTPSKLIYSETGLAAVRGWNRFLLSTPQPFPASSERGIIVKVVNASSSFSLVIDASGTPSGRSYFDQDGIGTYASLCATPFCGDVNMVGLLGSAGPPPPADIFSDSFE